MSQMLKESNYEVVLKRVESFNEVLQNLEEQQSSKYLEECKKKIESLRNEIKNDNIAIIPMLDEYLFKVGLSGELLNLKFNILEGLLMRGQYLASSTLLSSILDSFRIALDIAIPGTGILIDFPKEIYSLWLAEKVLNESDAGD